ncbi:MAG: hypothetical protein ACREN4_00690 [Candidatus Dormibacteria bacterium]
MIWVFFVGVFIAHEAAHALALRGYGIKFGFRFWYSRSFPWLGIGWKYFIDGVMPRHRHTVLVVGPLVEAILWVAGALIFPAFQLGLLAMAAATLFLNRVVPGGDLWKAHRLPHTAG